MFSNKYIYSLLRQLLPLILIFNIQACEGGCKGVKDTTASISMKIKQSLPLIDGTKDLAVTFQKDNSEKIALVGNFKLKVSILEEKSFREDINGSKLQFIEAGKGVKAFPESDSDSKIIFEKVLTEFTNYTKLEQADEVLDFETNFTLLPAKGATKVKLMFELLDVSGKNVQNLEIEWIKSRIMVETKSEFEGNETKFTIQSLKGDIDPNKIKVKLETEEGEEEAVEFLFKANSKSKSTLKGLLPDTDTLAENEVSNPIPIKVNNLQNVLTANFTIQLFDIDAGDHSLPLVKQPVEWSEAKLDAAVKEQEKIRKHTERKKKRLEKDEKENKQDIKEAHENLKEKQKELKKEKEEKLKQLKEKEAQDLKGKSGEEEKNIKQGYEKQKKEIEDKYEQNLAAVKKEFEDTKKADEAQEKEDEKQEKELREQSKKQQESEKKEEEELRKKKKGERKHTPLQIEMMLKKRKKTDKKFIIELFNTGGELNPEATQGIKIWYEIKDHIGDITKVQLKHKGKSIAPANTDEANLSKLFNNEKTFHNIVEKLSKGKMEQIPFDIEGIDKKAEHMKIVIHIEGAPDNPSPITVNWKSKEEEKKEKGEEENNENKKANENAGPKTDNN